MRTKVVGGLNGSKTILLTDEENLQRDTEEAQFAAEKVEQALTQYQRDRQYAPTGDQLDMLWHAIDAGIDLKQSEFYTANKAVKDAYPKD